MGVEVHTYFRPGLLLESIHLRMYFCHAPFESLDVAPPQLLQCAAPAIIRVQPTNASKQQTMPGMRCASFVLISFAALLAFGLYVLRRITHPPKAPPQAGDEHPG